MKDRKRSKHSGDEERIRSLEEEVSRLRDEDASSKERIQTLMAKLDEANARVDELRAKLSGEETAQELASIRAAAEESQRKMLKERVREFGKSYSEYLKRIQTDVDDFTTNVLSVGETYLASQPAVDEAAEPGRADGVESDGTVESAESEEVEIPKSEDEADVFMPDVAPIDSGTRTPSRDELHHRREEAERQIDEAEMGAGFAAVNDFGRQIEDLKRQMEVLSGKLDSLESDG